MYAHPVSHGSVNQFSLEPPVDHARVAQVIVPNPFGNGVEIRATKFDPREATKINGVSSAIF